MAKSKWDYVKSRFPDIKRWLREGLYEKQIIQQLAVGKTSWEKYKHEHPELAELLLSGRENQNAEVTNSLYKNAVGFYYYTTEAVKVKDAEGNESVQKVEVKKFSPPQTDACKYWLNNRDKKNWANNPQMIDLKREEVEIRRQESQFRTW